MQGFLVNMLPTLVTSLLGMLPSGIVKEGLDALFDVLEERVQDSDNDVDDTIVLPVLRRMRQELGIVEAADSEYADA